MEEVLEDSEQSDLKHMCCMKLLRTTLTIK